MPGADGMLEGLVVEDLSSFTVFAREKDQLRWVKDLLQDFGPERELKRTPKSLIFRKSLAGRVLFVKAYARGRGFRRLAEFFRVPRALRVMANYLSFSSAGFLTQVPLGGWVLRGGFFSWGSGLVFDWLPPEKKASQVFLRILASSEDPEPYLRLLLLYLRRMHEAGFYLRDPKVSNFFCLPEGVLLVDLDSLKRFRGKVPYGKRRRNLEVLARSLERLGLTGALEMVVSLYEKLLPQGEET